MLLTVRDVARALDVAPETVRLWANLGKLPAQRTASGMRLFEEVDVARARRSREASRRALETARTKKSA